VKIVLPRTLAEPGTIPWEMITSGEDIDVDILVNALMEEAETIDFDEIQGLIDEMTKRILENAKRAEK